jgi:dTDP-4-amino-4,6-dideoxygalactose transaminase
MKSIHRLCSEYDVKIIEDASHAIGGCYLGEPIGNCKYSNITVLSFHPVKIITTAEGGAALTNDKELAKKIELLRSHGITRNEEMMKEVSHGPWYYQQLELGYNYRMTDIQGALGYSQMTKLAEFVASRHRIAKKYNSLLSDLPIKLPTQINDAYSSYHLYIIRLNLNKISTSHKEIFEGLRSAGIGVNLHYIPVHLHPFYQSLGFKYGDYPESERYYSEAISLPIYPNLLEKDQNTVVQILKSLLI